VQGLEKLIHIVFWKIYRIVGKILVERLTLVDLQTYAVPETLENACAIHEVVLHVNGVSFNVHIAGLIRKGNLSFVVLNVDVEQVAVSHEQIEVDDRYFVVR